MFVASDVAVDCCKIPASIIQTVPFPSYPQYISDCNSRGQVFCGAQSFARGLVSPSFPHPGGNSAFHSIFNVSWNNNSGMKKEVGRVGLRGGAQRCKWWAGQDGEARVAGWVGLMGGAERWERRPWWVSGEGSERCGWRADLGVGGGEE